MLTALAILFWLIVGLMVLVLVLICIPMHLKITFRSEPTSRFGLELRFVSSRAPGLMLIKTERDAAGRKKSNGGAEEPKKKKRKATQGWASRLRPTKMARAIPALLGDTLSRIHFDRLRVQVEFGLGDPADTGRAFGQLVPLAFLPIGPAMSFDLRPNFEDRCLKGEVDLALHFIPAWLALPAIRFAWQQFVVRS